MTIEGLLIAGAIFGLALGLMIAQPKVGCTGLLIVPVAMIGYLALWQSLHPENIRSTSALDFLFGPLWPSLGAIVGYPVGCYLRVLVARRKRKDS